MRKVRYQAIRTIMTFQTRIAIGSHVIISESLVDLRMAGQTGVHIERGHIVSMAVHALEGIILRLELVSR